MKHTELPWKTSTKAYLMDKGTNLWVRQITAHNNRLEIALLPAKPNHKETDVEYEANAAFIVQACNSHYDLLEACDVAFGVLNKRDSHEEADIKEVIEILEKALAKARAKEVS